MYFITQLVDKKFDVLPDVLDEPISVSALIGDWVVAKRVYRSGYISLFQRVILID